MSAKRDDRLAPRAVLPGELASADVDDDDLRYEARRLELWEAGLSAGAFVTLDEPDESVCSVANFVSWCLAAAKQVQCRDNPLAWHAAFFLAFWSSPYVRLKEFPANLLPTFHAAVVYVTDLRLPSPLSTTATNRALQEAAAVGMDTERAAAYLQRFLLALYS